jgi:cell division protease FtsH
MEKETLDKEQIAKVFEPLRRRSRRPAWTGSPDRNPSTIPPVQIPEKIRVAAAEGAGPDERQGAVVITPPGAGGDVHGDPGLAGAPPEPPSPSPNT